MSGTSIRFRLPPAALFKFPPDAEPQVLPAPDPSESFRTFAAPFKIDQSLYNAAFSPAIPITIASVYAVTVLYMNKVNRDRAGKPYAISRTLPFHIFVVAHNVALAVFSSLVFWAMLRALAHTWPSYREYPLFGKLWPGIRTQHGLAGAADALCKMHGPRGFGDSAAYNAKKGLWEIKNKIIHLGTNGSPDPTDLGRLWNEGLGFWGWFFYLSKFYEVVDTAIILLKGKRSSTLQTYHHAGAMFCMWAGMRYMSPPIWMFVWINSGIHAMMYTYYTLSVLGFKVPRRLKKTLTTMQIGQFLVGFTFAAGHLFVEYTVPAHISYAGRYGIKQAASAVLAAAETIATAVADPTATAGTAAWLKKLAYRAAGEEGLAENVRNEYGEVFGPEADHVQSTLEQMKRNVAYETVNCIDTTGQSFAIWLNLIYLAPLTWLFLRFFIRSYSRRSSVSTASHRRKLSKSAEDAAHGVERDIDSVGRSAEDGLSELATKAQKKFADNRRISETIEKFESGLSKGYAQAMAQGRQLGEQAVKSAESVKEKVGKWKDKEGGELTPQKVKEQAQSLINSTTETAKTVSDNVKEQTQQAEAITDDVSNKAEKAAEAAQDEVKRRDDAKSTVEDTKGAAKQGTEQIEGREKESIALSKEAADTSSPTVKEEDTDVPGTEQAQDEGDDGSTAQGPEESGILVERHEEAAEVDPKQLQEASKVEATEDQTTTDDTSATGVDQSSVSQESNKENEEPDQASQDPTKVSQGLSTTDSTIPGAKSYADELK